MDDQFNSFGGWNTDPDRRTEPDTGKDSAAAADSVPADIPAPAFPAENPSGAHTDAAPPVAPTAQPPLPYPSAPKAPIPPPPIYLQSGPAYRPQAPAYAPQSQQTQPVQAQPPQTYTPPQYTNSYGYYGSSPDIPVTPVKKKKGVKVLFIVLLVVLVGVGAAIGIKFVRDGLAGITGSKTENSSAADSALLTTEAAPQGVALAVDAQTPINVYEKVKNANVAVLVYSGSTSGNFYGGSNSGQATGEGSGIVIHQDSSGEYTYIVTCAHVIEDASAVTIETLDGTSYDASIVGSDSRTDVAVLKVKAALPGVSFGDSDALKVGETVYAIGNPGGTEFKGSFTNGIVSAIDRPLESTYKMTTIQHTAPINPGNSGGALVNSAGQVVGINSQKIVDTEFEGMGFAIPSKQAQEVVNALITKGYVPNRPKLGIQYMKATDTQAGLYAVRMNDLPSGSLIIAKIDADSSLADSSVQPGDVITHANGKELNKADVLLTLIENGKVGDTIKLTIARVSGQSYRANTFDVEVTLIEDKGTREEATSTQPWYEVDPFGFGY